MSRIIPTSKRPIWVSLLIALVLHASLISVQVGHRFDTSFIRAWILDGLAPLEKLFDRGVSGVVYLWGHYFALIHASEENERLKTQIEDLRMQLQKESQDVLESQRLRALLSLKDTALGKTVVARVIGRDPTRANQTVTIDKGLSQGVKPDSAVIVPDGIVGRVIHSSRYFSIVQLISDAQSGVGVMLEPNRRQGILKGTGAAELELEYIDDDNDLKEDQTFITSGLDRIYPRGLPVGKIRWIGASRRLLKTVRVQPNADLGRLEEVVCIIEHAQNVDVVDPQGSPTP